MTKFDTFLSDLIVALIVHLLALCSPAVAVSLLIGLSLVFILKTQKSD